MQSIPMLSVTRHHNNSHTDHMKLLKPAANMDPPNLCACCVVEEQDAPQTGCAQPAANAQRRELPVTRVLL